MAKCKHGSYDRDGFYCEKNMYKHCVYFLRGCVIPKGKNPKAKIKPKLKRVKAWAWKSESGKWLATEWDSNDRIPCTILIYEKYLKGKGRKK